MPTLYIKAREYTQCPFDADDGWPRTAVTSFVVMPGLSRARTALENTSPYTKRHTKNPSKSSAHPLAQNHFMN